MGFMDEIRKTHNDKCRCSVCTYECEPNHVINLADKPSLTKNELDRIKKVLHEHGYEVRETDQLKRRKKNETASPPSPDPAVHHGHD